MQFKSKKNNLQAGIGLAWVILLVTTLSGIGTAIYRGEYLTPKFNKTKGAAASAMDAAILLDQVASLQAASQALMHNYTGRQSFEGAKWGIKDKMLYVDFESSPAEIYTDGYVVPEPPLSVIGSGSSWLIGPPVGAQRFGSTPAQWHYVYAASPIISQDVCVDFNRGAGVLTRSDLGYVIGSPPFTDTPTSTVNGVEYIQASPGYSFYLAQGGSAFCGCSGSPLSCRVVVLLKKPVIRKTNL